MLLPIALCLLAEFADRFTFAAPVQPARKVQAIAHRGLWRVAPENTRPALEACVQHGVDWAEVDVRLSKDGKHLLIHNARVDGVTDGKGSVKSLLLGDLVKLDAGEPYAPRFRGTTLITLESALAVAKGRLNLYLDCKDVDPALLVQEIRSAGMEHQVVIYADAEVLQRFEKVIGDGSKLALMKKWHPQTETLDQLSRFPHLAAVEIDADEITPQVCQKARERGLIVQAKVVGETWDNQETWARVIDAGAVWLQTDWPLELYAFLTNRAIKKRPILFACHRGASRQAPENTLAAVEAAIAMGADFVELDVRTTKDGRFVLVHDGSLNRTTNGKGSVSDANLDDIRKLDAGAWFGSLYRGAQVPTLEEALQALKGRARFYCDAKNIAPEALKKALDDSGMTEATVVYAGVAYLKSLKAVAPELKRMPPLGRIEDIDRLVDDLKPHAFDVRWSALSKELVDRCHARGVLVFSDAIGINENHAQYLRAIEIGVDLIQTDYPDRVLRAFERRETTSR